MKDSSLPHPVLDPPVGAAAPERQVRAASTPETLFVYQAYRPEIALPAVQAQRFVPPFQRERMTWIKPSFAWMMYRCGWGEKPGQERVLRIEMRRGGFESALAQSCPTSFQESGYGDLAAWRQALRKLPVRIQWDPERTLRLEPLPWRALQVGLGGEAAERYADEWIVGIEDITETARAVRRAVESGGMEDRAEAALGELLLPETPYPLPAHLEVMLALDAPSLLLPGEHHCRVCGQYHEDPPWGADGGCPTYDFCDCCGVEPGNEDCTPIGARRFRDAWLAAGAPWFEPRRRPGDWDLETQLRSVPEAFL